MAPLSSARILRVLALVACVLGSIQLAYAGPIERHAASVNGSAAPVNGSVAPVNGSAPHVNGSAAPINRIAGYATLHGGTKGGRGGSTVTVKTLAALKKAVAGKTARIVKVLGIINLRNTAILVGSYKSILGVGSKSGFINGGLYIKGQKNVIVRNLKFSYSLAPIDAIGVDTSTNIWIDHNEFLSDMSHGKDYYDGLVDITHACDYVTVSWNRFHDHYKVSLVGHSDTNAIQDTGHLHVTYHHNYFYNVGSRLPSIRFGSGHVYNNLFENADTACHSRMGAKMLVESNVFSGVKTAIQTNMGSEKDGYAVQRNNILGGGAIKISQAGSPTLGYNAIIDDVSSVSDIVKAYSGIGKMNLHAVV
ncbi:pectin lyase fold/virulence factor [Jimgerdemannia flammicorona]|uniref:Pectin lyase fold/virulence factor n=1 Tax=Jimgerdemannia flammicorona TaxID=994334 RepID=A0A433QXC1_9FUNG|nr:pectin lyase fold/virulence factor [Jimgerdemannia flammicorona]